MRRNERVKPLPNAPEDEKTIPEQLTSGRVLFRSTVWNFIGQAIPFLIAIPALPVLVTKLGIERFGVLTLVWMVIGYFNMFDLGLGRSMTQMLAHEVGKDANGNKVAGIVRSGLALMSLISFIGASIVWITAPWLVHSVLNIPFLLQEETLRCLYIIAITMPFIVVSSGLFRHSICIPKI